MRKWLMIDPPPVPEKYALRAIDWANGWRAAFKYSGKEPFDRGPGKYTGEQRAAFHAGRDAGSHARAAQRYAAKEK